MAIIVTIYKCLVCLCVDVFLHVDACNAVEKCERNMSIERLSACTMSSVAGYDTLI